MIRRTPIIRILPLAACCLLLHLQADAAEARDHAMHHMSIDTAGVVMNENVDELPRDCTALSRDYAFTVRAGRDYAVGQPGVIWGYDQPELRVDPCSRIEITFVNEDEVRHQWMVHGLPRYLYPAGMFHLEAAGGHRVRGTFIVPGDDRTYLVHCDMAQHMEKGLRGQLVVGAGSGDLWGVTGISDDFFRYDYLPPVALSAAALTVLVTFCAGLWYLRRSRH